MQTFKVSDTLDCASTEAIERVLRDHFGDSATIEVNAAAGEVTIDSSALLLTCRPGALKAWRSPGTKDWEFQDRNLVAGILADAVPPASFAAFDETLNVPVIVDLPLI